MDPDAFSASLLKWDPRAVAPPPPPTHNHRLFEAVALSTPPPAPYTSSSCSRPISRELGGLEDFFQAYGIRYYTAAKIAELGFTVNTLLDMKDEELDEMMNSLSHIFRWDLLVGERYGIKAAVRAERRRLLDEEESRRRHHHHHHLIASSTATTPPNNALLDALSQEGLSEEPVQQAQKEAVGSGGGGRGSNGWDAVATTVKKKQRRRKAVAVLKVRRGDDNDDDDEDEDLDDQEDNIINNNCNNHGVERQREHPFIVTEPGEVARGKKNGLDYLFHLYELCREFLIQVQNLAKEKGEKCPSKVTNQVFRYAKKTAGASYINKPKMRHYVHCYALHCLDEEASNELRRVYKERGENVGAWRQACYKPLVNMAAMRGWDIDGIFNSHPRLSIWYVPTKLRQLCHAERNSTTTTTSSGAAAAMGSCSSATSTNPGPIGPLALHTLPF